MFNCRCMLLPVNQKEQTMSISAHEIANLVQNLVDAKSRMDETASHVEQMTGCESCYDASHYVNRAMWSSIPQFPMPSGNVSVLAANAYLTEQQRFRDTVNTLLEGVADAQNEYDHAMQNLRNLIHTLPESKTGIFLYVILEGSIYKIGYEYQWYCSRAIREPIFEQVEEMEC